MHERMLMEEMMEAWMVEVVWTEGVEGMNHHQ